MKGKLWTLGPALLAGGFLLNILGRVSYISGLSALGIVLMTAGLVLTVRRHMAPDGLVGKLFLLGTAIFLTGAILVPVAGYLWIDILLLLGYGAQAAGIVLMMLGYSRPDRRVDLKPFFQFKQYKNRNMVGKNLLHMIPGVLLIFWGVSEYLMLPQIAGGAIIAYRIYRILKSQTLPDTGEISDEAAVRPQDPALSREIRERQLLLSVLRIVSKGLNVAAIAMIAAAIFSETYWLLFAGGLLYGLGGMVLPYYEKELKGYVSDNIVREALEDVFAIENFQPFGTIPFDTVRGTDMGLPVFNCTGGSDYVKGSYKGLPVELCDMTLIHRTEYQNEDGRTEERDEEVFRGMWLICDFGRELSADLRLWERKNAEKILGGKGIPTENDQFNRQFRVESEVPEEAFYILTPHMMEYILEMDRKARGKTHMCFARSGKVHIVVRKDQDSFEVGRHSKNATQLRRQFIQEIRYLTDLIDELRLVDTLYRQ